MLNYGQDQIKNIYQNVNYNALGNVSYNDTQFKLFAYINGNLVDKEKDISSIAPYVDIYYEEQNFNYNYGINSSRRRVPVKWCD
jgi:hypothetical protein